MHFLVFTVHLPSSDEMQVKRAILWTVRTSEDATLACLTFCHRFALKLLLELTSSVSVYPFYYIGYTAQHVVQSERKRFSSKMLTVQVDL